MVEGRSLILPFLAIICYILNEIDNNFRNHNFGFDWSVTGTQVTAVSRPSPFFLFSCSSPSLGSDYMPLVAYECRPNL